MTVTRTIEREDHEPNRTAKVHAACENKREAKNFGLTDTWTGSVDAPGSDEPVPTGKDAAK